MKTPEFTRDGYPTKETLSAIRCWDWDEASMRSLLEFIRTAWRYPEMVVQSDGLWKFSTGGWSGNEDLMDAFSKYHMARVRYSAYFSGGHYAIATTREAANRMRAAKETFFEGLPEKEQP